MILSIDFSIYCTKIGYMKDGSFINLTPEAIKPGFNIETNTPDLYDNLWEYFLFIDQKYIKPLSITPQVINVTIPNYINSNMRSLIRQVIKTLYNSPRIKLLPQPASTIAGYNFFNNNYPLNGDILIIDRESSGGYYSLVSISADNTEIIIELQNALVSPSSLEELPDIIKSELIPAVRKLGLYDNGWQLDHILILDDFKENYDWTKIFAPVPVITCNRNIIAEGLAKTANLNQPWPTIKTIYPFDFYIKKYNPNENSYVMEIIPFAASELELDLNSKYVIANLATNSFYNLSDLDNKVAINIYEVKKGTSDVRIENFTGQEIIIENPLPETGLVYNMDIILDLHKDEFTVCYTQSGREANNFSLVPQVILNEDWQLFVNLHKSFNSELNNEVKQFLNRLKTVSEPSLHEQLELTRYKLLTLLQYLT